MLLGLGVNRGGMMAWKSGQSSSADLRGRVRAAIDGGLSAKMVAARFQVSVSYIYKALGRRDATGEIQFGAFKNQIEYQNAGAGINNAMKKEVLAAIDPSALTGKTVSVVGAFTLVNPKNWLVTPVELKVQ